MYIDTYMCIDTRVFMADNSGWQWSVGGTNRYDYNASALIKLTYVWCGPLFKLHCVVMVPMELRLSRYYMVRDCICGGLVIMLMFHCDGLSETIVQTNTGRDTCN